MPDMIRDGTGQGYLAKVNQDNRLSTESISGTIEHHINHHAGQAYNLLFNVTPTGANDCFLYVKNTFDTDMVLEGITVRVGGAEQIEIKAGDAGTPTGGSSATPANLNLGSANVASGDFETGNNITGLSGGSVIEKLWLSSTTSTHINFDQDIIVPENDVITIYAVTGGINIAGTLVFNYHTRDEGGPE
jgi:hypothetical protein